MNPIFTMSQAADKREEPKVRNNYLLKKMKISSKRLNWWMKFILTIKSNQKLRPLTCMN